MSGILLTMAGPDRLQVDEAVESQIVVAAAKADEPGGLHLQRVPGLAGERELELREADCHSPCSGVPVAASHCSGRFSARKPLAALATA